MQDGTNSQVKRNHSLPDLLKCVYSHPRQPGKVRVVEGAGRVGREGVGHPEHLSTKVIMILGKIIGTQTSPLGSVSQLGEVKVKPLSVPASRGKAWRGHMTII